MKILSWTPASAIYGMPYEAANLACDIARFGRMVRGELEPGPRRIITNATEADLEALVATGAPIACDIETAPGDRNKPWTGKDPTRAKLKTVGFGTCDTGLSFMWGTDVRMQAACTWVLAAQSILKVFHNGPWFDLRVLRRYNMPVSNYVDTRDMRRALVAKSRLSLRYLASIYTDFHNWKDAGDDDEKTWASDNDERLMTYNALDCVVTARVHRGLVRDWSTAND